MQRLLDHEENTQINMAIETKNGLSKEQGDRMMSVIRKIILKTIAPAGLVATIKKDISLGEDQAKKLGLDLLGRRFLPMQWYIGNVEGLIRGLGGHVEEYLAEAKKLYPEVYQASSVATVTPTVAVPAAVTPAQPAVQPSASSSLLDNLEERLTTFKGRAEVLLRMTALSQRIETAVNAKAIDEQRGQALLQALDALSYAVNTQDLNPLEVQAIKRRLAKVVAETENLKR